MAGSKDDAPKPQVQPDNRSSNDTNLFETIKQKFSAHSANPGPAVPDSFTAQQEGTKEERRAKAEALNK